MTKDQPQPLISVVITCYNYDKYIREAIDSVLLQTYDNIDLIVIDDGSTDNSLKIINEYKEKKQITIVTRENKGIVYTRNEALDLARGEFICFLDADDFFDSDYIENMVSVAQEYDADVVYPNWRVFGDKEYIKTFPEFDLQKLIVQEIHCTSESLIRRSAIENSVFESEEVAEDWDFFLGLALRGKKFKLAHDCYINYRVRSNTRATANPYWDDMYHFFSILEKWSIKYPDQVRPLDLPVYAGITRDEHIASQNSIIEQKEEFIKVKDEIIGQLESDVRSVKLEIENIRNSRSYRLARASAYVASIPRRLRSKISQNRKNRLIDLAYSKQVEFVTKGISEYNGAKIAVVAHLFYTDNWPLFNKKLKLIDKELFDLYITIPSQNEEFSEVIKRDYPNVKIMYSPNRGRDVLPFLTTAKILYKTGYRTVLKFHSKKSTHWDGGQGWLESILDQIIPDNRTILEQVIEVTKEENFGLLGPANEYYPLTVNFPANGRHMAMLISKLKGEKVAYEILQERRREYGFFGGTMFWINLESIKDLFEYSSASYFEPEAGQIDATFAHALERLFCIIPEIDKKDIYESTGSDVVKRPYKSSNIPDWSKDHDK